MNLVQVTLALLCLAVCLKTGVALSCVKHSGNSLTGGSFPNCGADETCITYRDFNTGKFEMGCSSKNCKDLGYGETYCKDCKSADKCNEKLLGKASCQKYIGPSTTAIGDVETCDTGMTCLMYRAANNGPYTRQCSTDLIADCSKITNAQGTDCTDCKTDTCNKAPFSATCYEYNGDSKTEKKEQTKLCPSGRCIMYKETTAQGKYVRGCVDDTTTCSKLSEKSTMCTECSEADCNKDPFPTMCYSYSGPSLTDLGAPTPCKSGTCLMFKDVGKYVRKCHTTEDTTGKNTCKADNCNKAAFEFTCHAYKGDSKTEKNAQPTPCPSGKCIMYTTKPDNYVRGCADDKTTCSALSDATPCTECSATDCNKDPFPTICYSYSGTSTTDLGAPTLGKSGTCLMYRAKNGEYKRQNSDSKFPDCSKITSDIGTGCTDCKTDNCNKAPFQSTCHVYNGDSKTDKGTATTPCKSGMCIMYKDHNTRKYVRGCVDDKISCSALKKDTIQCYQCSGDKCNGEEIKAASTFSLDARLTAIAFAGVLAMLRSV